MILFEREKRQELVVQLFCFDFVLLTLGSTLRRLPITPGGFSFFSLSLPRFYSCKGALGVPLVWWDVVHPIRVEPKNVAAKPVGLVERVLVLRTRCGVASCRPG